MKRYGITGKVILAVILLASTLNLPAQVLHDKIVFSRNQSGNDWDLWLMNRDGTNEVKLTENNYRDTGPYFNNSGTKIVFGRITSTMPMTADVYIINSDGTNEINLTNIPQITGPALSPKFSPDGTKVVFDVQNTPGNGDIYIINTDGTGLTALLTDSNDDSSPHYSPDGLWIVFQRMISSGADPKSKICKIPVSGGSVTELTRGNDLDEMPCWSPDGNYIVFKRGVTTTDICRIPYNHNPQSDTDIVNLTNSPNSIDDAPRYSIEGDKIAFMSTHGYNVLDSMEIIVMNPDGSSPQRLTYNNKADFDPAFSPKSPVKAEKNLFNLSGVDFLQNYPNPFNSETTLDISFDKAEYITLIIYDEDGKVISDLYKGYAKAGRNIFRFNADNIPSGVYFCKLKGKEFELTKKMLLIK